MIRLAAVGTGAITRTMASAVHAVPGITLTCLCSRDAGRGRAFADELGIPDTVADLDALLARTDVDAVYLASPNGVHEAQASAAIAAGKHVLVEKPAVPTAAAFAALLERAAAAGVVLMEAIRNVHDPALDAVRAALPRLGPVRRVSFRYCQRSARYDRVLAGERVNIFDPQLAGGALMDLGVYCVAPLVALFGEPDRELAASIPVAGGADGAGAVLAVYPGLIADLSYSKIGESSVPSEIQGEEGTLLIDHIADLRALTLLPRGGNPTPIALPPRPATNLVFEVAHFVAALEGRADVREAQAGTLASLRVMDAVRATQVSAS